MNSKWKNKLSMSKISLDMGFSYDKNTSDRLKWSVIK